MAAPVLFCLATNKSLNQLQQLQNRAFRIIDIKHAEAKRKYKIGDIEEIIDSKCKKKVNHILNRPKHPALSNMPLKADIGTRSSRKFRDLCYRNTKKRVATLTAWYKNICKTNQGRENKDSKIKFLLIYFSFSFF